VCIVEVMSAALGHPAGAAGGGDDEGKLEEQVTLVCRRFPVLGPSIEGLLHMNPDVRFTASEAVEALEDALRAMPR